jgi:hypothetical protein
MVPLSKAVAHSASCHTWRQPRARNIEGLDRRTTCTAAYALSQKIRKRVEEGFGWMKTVGDFRKTRFKGIGRTQLGAYFVGAACNLVRMATLALGPPTADAPR